MSRLAYIVHTISAKAQIHVLDTVLRRLFSLQVHGLLCLSHRTLTITEASVLVHIVHAVAKPSTADEHRQARDETNAHTMEHTI